MGERSQAEWDSLLLSHLQVTRNHEELQKQREGVLEEKKKESQRIGIHLVSALIMLKEEMRT